MKKESNQTQMTRSTNGGIREFTQKLQNKQHPPTNPPSLSLDMHGLADTSGTALFGRSSLWKEFMCFELPACAGRDIEPSRSACPRSSSLVELDDQTRHVNRCRCSKLGSYISSTADAFSLRGEDKPQGSSLAASYESLLRGDAG